MRKILVGAVVVVCIVVVGVAIFLIRPLIPSPVATQPQPQPQPQPTQPTPTQPQPTQPQQPQPQPTQPTPTQPQPTQPQPTPTPTPQPIPANFIVEDAMWRNATFVHRPDGTRIDGVIAFSNTPVGTKVFAPISGYFRVTTGEKEGQVKQITLHIVGKEDRLTYGPWERGVRLSATRFHILVPAGRPASFVEKGTLLATITDNSQLYPDHIKEKVGLVFEFGRDWELSAPANDPQAYVWETLQKGGK